MSAKSDAGAYMNAEIARTEIPSHVLEYLEGNKTLTLATASPAGRPHAATMVYANDDLCIYLWSRPGTLTARHIEQNPAVSFTIGEYQDDWSKTKGIQASGEARVLADPEAIERAIKLFEQKFPTISDHRPESLIFFRITTTQLAFIDNCRPPAGGRQALGFDYRRHLILSVFRDLPDQEAEALSSELDTVTVAPGEVIVQQGAPADTFFIIVEGHVEVVRDDDQKEVVVATLRGGQFFGEMAILRETVRNASVRAVTPTTLLAIGRAEFRDLVLRSRGTKQDFETLIQQRLQASTGG